MAEAGASLAATGGALHREARYPPPADAKRHPIATAANARRLDDMPRSPWIFSVGTQAPYLKRGGYGSAKPFEFDSLLDRLERGYCPFRVKGVLVWEYQNLAFGPPWGRTFKSCT